MSLAGWSNCFINENFWGEQESNNPHHEKPHCTPSSSLLGMAMLDVESFARNQLGHHANHLSSIGNQFSAAATNTNATGFELRRSTETVINEILRDFSDVIDSDDSNSPQRTASPSFQGFNMVDQRQNAVAAMNFVQNSNQLPSTMVDSSSMLNFDGQTQQLLALKRAFQDVPSQDSQGFEMTAFKKLRTMQGDENSESLLPGRRFRGYQMDQWTEAFEELLEFRKSNGHCQVPHAFDQNPALARWVKRQRYQYKLSKGCTKPSTMTEERIRALEDVGFIWDSHNTAWEERVVEMKRYKQIHGHCNVPSSYKENMRLATWVKCQRRQYKLFWQGKASNITLERIDQLQVLGFAWSLRTRRS